MISRRAWITSMASQAWCASKGTPYVIGKGPERTTPSGARVPFGWGAAPVLEETRFAFNGAGLRFRITNAVDSREMRQIEVLTSKSRSRVGIFDMRYAYALQPFELVLDSTTASKVSDEGVILRQIAGRQPVWIFVDGAPAPLLPHLLGKTEGSSRDNFERRLRGLESLQPFGWMEGCVLDALHALGDFEALDSHLRMFLPDARSLIYEDPKSIPADNRLLDIEGTLPFAAIAARRPDHASIDLAIRFWNAKRDAEDCVLSGGMTSAEGSYTVAWPMAVLGKARRDRTMQDLALLQLRLRRDRLVHADGLYLRRSAASGLTFRNWARGAAWYSLGLARTLSLFPERDDLSDLRDELERFVHWVLPMQDKGGLWNCFLDDPSSGPETSGSAGIAAALAISARLGIGVREGRAAAASAAAALVTQLTPDGFLSGAAQSNRGGEGLQRGGYRVISQMGMGLMGQLFAELSIPGRD